MIDVTPYIPLVEKIASHIHARTPNHVGFDDLRSAGMVGLCEAGRRFRLDRNIPFEAFARPRIRGAMLDELRHSDTLSKDIRTEQKQKAEQLRQLAHELGRPPTETEAAERLGLSLDEFQRDHVRLRAPRLVPIEPHSEPAHLRHPLEEATTKEAREALNNAVEHLNPRLQAVLHMMYVEDLRLNDVGAALGVTQSRACQLRKQALRELRELVDESLAA